LTADYFLDVALALSDAYPLRGFDAIQLAGYLMLRSVSGAEEPIFVCADGALLSAARNEGCPVLRSQLALTVGAKFKWAGNQEAVTFLGYRPIRS
jgi:hypothetical protein